MKSSTFITNKLEELDFNTVLEVGSGAGNLTETILKNFTIEKYISCDQDIEMCKLLQIRLFGTYFQLTNYSVKFENLDIGDMKFDLVIAAHVLESADCKEPIKVLDKMLESTNKYVVHTGVKDNDTEYWFDFQKFWSDKRENWQVTGYNIDDTRVLIVAEKQ